MEYQSAEVGNGTDHGNYQDSVSEGVYPRAPSLISCIAYNGP